MSTDSSPDSPTYLQLPVFGGVDLLAVAGRAAGVRGDRCNPRAPLGNSLPGAPVRNGAKLEKWLNSMVKMMFMVYGRYKVYISWMLMGFCS